MNPYLVLGVPRDADDARIRQAYLDAVKQAPPDTHPDRFHAVSEAYEKIKDEPSRMRYYLFHTDCPGDSPLDVFVRFHQTHGKLKPPPFETMKEFLRACAKT
jgi:DnaJ-class molecular chaperone